MPKNRETNNGIDGAGTPQHSQASPFIFQAGPAADEGDLFLTTDELWGWYGDGYLRAAQLLLNHAINGDTRDQNILLWPTLFLCRHWAELMLKAVLLDWSRARRQPKPDVLTHKLMPLWQRCRRIIEGLWPNTIGDRLKAAEAFFTQLSRADQSSISFRYPQDKDGAKTLRGLMLTGYPDMMRHMRALEELLGGVHCAILAELDAIAETEEYFREGSSPGP